MSNLSRLIIGYTVAIPLALALGFLVATPSTVSAATLGFVLFCLALPLFIQWHHAMLIISWNSAFMLGFLPGQPKLWLVLAVLSFGIAMLNHVLGLKTSLRAPELAKPLLLLLGVVLVTAWLRGGLGSKVLGGSSYGGRNYYYVLGAFMGYFALTAQKIAAGKSQRLVKWFFLSSMTNVLPNLTYLLGPSFYVVYNFVSVNSAITQAQSDYGLNVVNRFGDFGAAAVGLFCFLLARWGIRGIFQWHKPWRVALLAASVALALFSGFRAHVLFLVVLFAIQFIMEGLWKTSSMLHLGLLGILCLIPVLLFANKMPAAVQRSLAFLPGLEINPDIRAEAEGSIEWRLQMWRIMLPEIPKYMILGKGYALDPMDLDMTTLAARSGIISNYEEALYAGDYHSGPLSVLIPFGLLGMIAFVWLLWAGVKVLYCNSRYGDAKLRLANMTLFSFFLSQSLLFFFVFGAFNSQLVLFLGILGFSVSLNNGVCRKEVPKAVPVAAASAMALEPA
jgi:hypothetical protein